MVGGRVYRTKDCGDSFEVVCVERGTGENGAVKIAKEGPWKAIRPGDSFWWQGKSAYWTPQENCVSEQEAAGKKAGRDFDIQFHRLSGSYTPSIEDEYEWAKTVEEPLSGEEIDKLVRRVLERHKALGGE